MVRSVPTESRGPNPAENYERYFVPAIGAPLASGLVAAAALRSGERVLDVACGTGVVTRLAAERVGGSGKVVGADINPAMLGVARAVTPTDLKVGWHEAGAEETPFPDGAFDVVLCQMGLQFFPNKLAALREMRRVLVPGGRVLLNVPGPTPRIFSIFAEALARHVGAEAGSFAHLVFSLHDAAELRDLMEGAGFHDVVVRPTTETLRLPPPAHFLWQYIGSTPLSAALASAGDEQRAALERDICERWQPFVDGDALMLELRMTTAAAKK